MVLIHLIHLMQQGYSLIDPAMEEVLIEVPTMRSFAGIELISDQISYYITIIDSSSTKNKAGKRDPEMH
jgi:IS5 family transposase